jgi:hypothetical protein
LVLPALWHLLLDLGGGGRSSTVYFTFQLVEMIITITIFSTVAIMSTVMVNDTLKSSRRVQSQAFLYSEAQALMDQLTSVIARSGIDYEAYYSKNVLQDRGAPLDEWGWHTPNYGWYEQSFFNPGTGGPGTDGPYDGVVGYHVSCPSDALLTFPDDCPDETAEQSQGDRNTGTHPFDPSDSPYAFDPSFVSDPTFMNAMCESSTESCDTFDRYIQDDLILINDQGDERTVFTLECTDAACNDRRLSKVQLSGTDTDQNGVVDEWECMGKYTCNNVTGENGQRVPDPLDLTDTDSLLDSSLQNDFMPITPSVIDVTAFHVYVSPLEDPYLGVAETGLQVQPFITLLITLTLSDEYGSNILGDVPSISLQRTISTGVYGSPDSYEE